jgi:single-strand DNA-binding protein
VTCFGKTAENVQKFCQKGKQLYIEGKLHTSKFQDKDGKDQYSTEIIADEVRFLSGGRTEAGGSSSGGQYGGGGAGGGSADEDIPF